MRFAKTNIAGILLMLVTVKFALSQSIDVSLPDDAIGIAGSIVTIPITASDLTNRNVLSFQATLTFDAKILVPTGVTKTGTISDSLEILTNFQAGRVVIGAYHVRPLTGNGTLIFLHFQVDALALPGQTTDLKLDRFIFNSNYPPVNIRQGKFTVSAAFPDIFISSNLCDFGEVHLGSSTAKFIKIYNKGSTNLEVNSAIVSGAEAIAFIIESGGAPFGLAPGDSHDLKVRFTPTTLGEKNVILAITSNDPKHNHIDVQLHGKCTQATEQPPKPTYAFPNPFNPSTNPIKIYIDKEHSQNASIKIMDGRGNPIRIIDDRSIETAGTSSIMFWDGRDLRGDIVPNGIYFYVIENGKNRRVAGKIVVLR